MTTTALVGDIGSGKTQLMALLASWSTRDVYANFVIDIDNYHPLNDLEFIDLEEEDVDIFLDEITMIADSRLSTSVINRYVGYKSLQQRKIFADLYISTQFFHMIDKRLRDLVRVLIKCEEIEGEGFAYSFMDVPTGDIDYFFLAREDAKYIWEIYDSYQTINPARKRHYQLKRLRETDGAEYMREVRDIAYRIAPNIETFTHPDLRVALYDINEPVFIESELYPIVRDILKERGETHPNQT